MALIRTGAAAQPKTLGEWHAPANPISTNAGDVIDLIWENATVPTFSGCTQEVLLSPASNKRVVRLTATGNSVSYSGDNYMLAYLTY